MKKVFRNLLIMSISLVFVCSQNLLKLSATSSYPAEATPKIQVQVAVGSTALNDTTFLDDLRDALVARGVDFSKLDLTYTASTNFNPADKSLWDFYDHFGEWGEMRSDVEWETAVAYVIAHVPGYDASESSSMYVDDYYYEKSHNGYVIDYYDGSDYLTIDWPILDTLFADVVVHPLNYDQRWYSGIWVTNATTFLTANTSDYNSMANMFYDTSLGKVFLNYYDSGSILRVKEWPAGLSFVQTYAVIDFVNDSVNPYFNYMQVTGVQGPANVAFNMLYLFENEDAGIWHYPKPDNNPDKDNPINWDNDPHIVTRDNGNVLIFYGYGSPAFKDFMLSKSDTTDRKEITFDLDEKGVDSHSMQGGGFLFNILTEDDGFGELLMSGYAILFESSGGIGLYEIDHVNVDDFHNEEDYDLNEMSGVTLIQTFAKDTDTLHSVKITIDNNVLNFFDNDIQPIVNFTLPEVYGNRFGPLASYSSHGCSQLSFFTLSNLRMNTVSTVVKTIDQVVDELTWESGTLRYLINLEEDVDAGLNTTKINAIGTKLKAAKAAYIAVGSTTNSTQQNLIITANGKLGLFIPQTDTDVIDQIVEYIFAKVHPIIITNIVDIELAKLGKPYILKSGDTASTVTGNIKFLNPLSSYSGSTVKWTTNHPSNLSGAGIVTRPSFTIGNVATTATMAVTYEGITVKKNYAFTILKLPITATEKLALDVTSLKIVYVVGDSAESVKGNLGFTASLPQGSTVLWSTDKPELIDDTGKVVRPIFSAGDQPVVISALITNGSQTQTVTFNVKVIKNEKTELEKAEEDGNGIIDYATGEDKDNVKTIVEMAKSGANGSTILWTSSHPDILTENGIVSRPKDKDLEVTLTATIKNGQANVVKTFKVLVKKDETPKMSLNGYLPYLLGLLVVGVAAWWLVAKNRKKGAKEV